RQRRGRDLPRAAGGDLRCERTRAGVAGGDARRADAARRALPAVRSSGGGGGRPHRVCRRRARPGLPPGALPCRPRRCRPAAQDGRRRPGRRLDPRLLRRRARRRGTGQRRPGRLRIPGRAGTHLWRDRSLSSTRRAAGPAGVACRAVVVQRAGQGLFVVSVRARDVLVASGDAAPDGGRFTNFEAPVFAANRVVFHAAVSGGAHTEGIFRVAGAPQAPPSPVEALAWLGGPAPGGGSFLAFGGPAGNAAGTVALTADLQGGPAARAVLVFP